MRAAVRSTLRLIGVSLPQTRRAYGLRVGRLPRKGETVGPSPHPNVEGVQPIARAPHVADKRVLLPSVAT